jgi:hypothetical protein
MKTTPRQTDKQTYNILTYSLAHSHVRERTKKTWAMERMRAGGVTEVVEGLLHRCKPLSSNPSTANK